ncbi:MAG: polysaccharide biosynthesis tyrosine autokinase [Prevotellaceae bacterium]|nr:polysaccharide biosynthesis tyrosine autokinase [Prevotellaceae bacterium]
MADYVTNEDLQREEESNIFSLANLWTIVVLNWQWILLSTFIALGLAFIYLRYASPVYNSAMKVLVKDNKGNNRSMGGLMELESMGIISNTQGFDNELELLNSTNVNGRVVEKLKLYVSYAIEGSIRKHELYKNNPVIVDMPQHQLSVLQAPIMLEMEKEGEGLKIKGKVVLPERKEPVIFEREVKKLPGTINTPMGTIIFQHNPGIKWDGETLYAFVMPVDFAARFYMKKFTATATSKTTTVANIIFTDTQVERSLDYLNELIICYNEDANEDKNEVAVKTEEFIKERLDFIRNELDITEGELEQYKKSNDLVNLANNANVALASTTEYQKMQVEFETQLNLINALVNYVNNPANVMKVIPANLGLDNVKLNDVIGKYNELVQQRNRLLKSSSEDNPYVQRLTGQIEEMWPSIRVSLEAVRSDVMAQKASADSQYSKYSNRISHTPTQERALTNMSRQQEIKANLYLLLLQKREENYISLASTAAKARIIDSPQLIRKVAPKTSLILFVALIFGMLLPVGIVLLLDLLRFRIGGREDVEKLTKLNILADIPLAAKGVDGEKTLVVRENTNDSMEEAFRGLRTNLRFVLQSGEKVILCTSCLPSEGKSFVSTNLAMSLALMGKKVVIIGLDIRKPRLVKLFGLPPAKKGITTFLSGDSRSFDVLDEQIEHGVVNKNLDVLPAGVIPPNPSELLSREQLDCAIDLLKEHYDYIILDTPPIALVSDTLSIGRVANTSLLVCRADYSPRSNFEIINSLHAEGKLPKINLVLNGVDMKKKKYGYYYGYGKYGKYGRYGKAGYGSYGVYGHYGDPASQEHTEK